MGGSLTSISGMKRKSQFDAVIEENFQTHLYLTLLTNIHLFNKYDNYMAMINLESPAIAKGMPESLDTNNRQGLQKMVS